MKRSLARETITQKRLRADAPRVTSFADRASRLLCFTGLDTDEGNQRTLRDCVDRVIRNWEKQAERKKKSFESNQCFLKPSPLTCPTCGNTDLGRFVHDSSEGDTICTGADGLGCGTVVEEKREHEGELYRRIEDEDDRNHHGSTFDPLFSHAWNASTHADHRTMVGQLMRRVEQASNSMTRDTITETTEWYKDRHKKRAFDLIDEFAAREVIHCQAVIRAKGIFAAWRDVKDRVTKEGIVIAACLLAGEELQQRAHDSDYPF